MTYSDEFLPPDGSLSLRDLQLFFKRLRKKLSGGVRFLACGEYGETFFRPHYHAIIFGWRPEDLKKFFVRDGKVTYTSQVLADVWKLGHCTVADVTMESCSYVAQYVLKKQEHAQLLEKVDQDTGEVIPVVAPFITMSKNPGLGADWIKKYQSDVFPADEVIMNGRHWKVPRFYDEKLKEVDPEGYEKVKLERRKRAAENPNFEADRLRAKERIAEARLKKRPKRDAKYD